MSDLHPLFVSYFYPPAGGTGLPGSQRTVKFIRYIERLRGISVLSLDPDYYPEGLLLDFTPSLPIRNEIIVRTPIRDRFALVMSLRKRFLNNVTRDSQHVEEPGGKEFGRVDATDADCACPSLQQRVKDFLFHAYYFPDQIAAPWLKPAVHAGVKLVRQHKINVIFATGMPWTALEIGRRIGRKTRIPFIADFRDPWLGNPFLESKGWLLDYREKKCENRIIEQAALISANTEALRMEFLGRYPGMSEKKIITLPNGFDRQDFYHLETEMADCPESTAKLVMIHAGFLYGKRDPAPLLDALLRMCKHYPDCASLIEFHQYGSINLKYDLQDRYRLLFERDMIKLFDPIPFEECSRKMSEADLLVIIQPGTKTQIPSKLYDYLCINRPILTITPLDGALGTMIRTERFGDLFSPEAIDPLLDRLRQYCFQFAKGDWKKQPGYPGRSRFDISRISRLLEEKMLQIVKQ